MTAEDAVTKLVDQGNMTDAEIEFLNKTILDPEWFVENMMRNQSWDVESAVSWAAEVAKACVNNQNWRRFDT